MTIEKIMTNTRIGNKWGFSSGIASICSIIAFALYGRWHWQLFFAKSRVNEIPQRLSWQMVSTMKATSVILAVIGFLFAIHAIRKERIIISVLVMILALLALLTIPVST